MLNWDKRAIPVSGPFLSTLLLLLLLPLLLLLSNRSLPKPGPCSCGRIEGEGRLGTLTSASLVVVDTQLRRSGKGSMKDALGSV